MNYHKVWQSDSRHYQQDQNGKGSVMSTTWNNMIQEPNEEYQKADIPKYCTICGEMWPMKNNKICVQFTRGKSETLRNFDFKIRRRT